MSNQYGPRIVTDGLVLHLDAADRNSYPGSGTSWNDLSGNGNHGTFGASTAAPTFSADNGGSIVFDGNNDRVSLTAGSDFAYGTGDFTIESWVRPTAFASLGKAIFTQTVSGTNYFLFGLGASGQVGIRMTLSGGGSDILGPSNISLNIWSHVAASRISGIVTVYVNAFAGTPTTNNTNLTNTTYIPTIGSYTHSDIVTFAGNISNLRIYKGKGFTASEVQQNYNATKGRYGL